VYADSFRCHFGKKGSWKFGYYKALPGVFVSQPSLYYAQVTQYPASGLFGFGAWFLIEIFRFLNCGARKAFCGHFGHIQRRAHVGLFQLYPTSMPCRSCSYVEHLQDMS
jgi:hypothetical protein